jgi:uncharacterized protein
LRPAIVVTGASSGIGREIVRVAAREGTFMLLLGRSLPALEELVAELRAQGAQAAALSIDLSDPEAGDHIERTLSDLGLYCDVLVNSAGFGLFGAAAELDRAEQLNLLDVSARALTDLTLRFIPGMVMRERGGVLNVGSLTGFTPGPQMAVYYAAKNYVQTFSAALATELANTGVTVTCMCPGPLRGTAFFDRCTTVGHTRLSKIMPRSNARQAAEAGWRRFNRRRRVHSTVHRPCDCRIGNSIAAGLRPAADQRPAKRASQVDEYALATWHAGPFSTDMNRAAPAIH